MWCRLRNSSTSVIGHLAEEHGRALHGYTSSWHEALASFRWCSLSARRAEEKRASRLLQPRSMLGRMLLMSAVCCFLPIREAHAYSVLTHEAIVDAAWQDSIVPLLRARFRPSADEILRARAFAYGGCLIQDLGYYPFSSRLFGDLTHYVRSGDFVEALVREARNTEELAFALGALAHYTADNVGHPSAVNLAVPLTYPKLRSKFGDRVTYQDDPTAHPEPSSASTCCRSRAAGICPTRIS